jgi:serine/threonine protein kinase
LLQACEAEELHRRSLHSDASTQPGLTGRVGNYAIDRLLGRGGMGAVYLAHRVDGQFEQQAAVKLIDLPLATDFFRDRFRAERQILAGLSHPYIAKLLDGGVSEHGDLYLAMEYIDGVPITDFCESRPLDGDTFVTRLCCVSVDRIRIGKRALSSPSSRFVWMDKSAVGEHLVYKCLSSLATLLTHLQRERHDSSPP